MQANDRLRHIGIEHQLTKIEHPWTNELLERRAVYLIHPDGADFGPAP
jgi:hypothetical protein